MANSQRAKEKTRHFCPSHFTREPYRSLRTVRRVVSGNQVLCRRRKTLRHNTHYRSAQQLSPSPPYAPRRSRFAHTACFAAPPLGAGVRLALIALLLFVSVLLTIAWLTSTPPVPFQSLADARRFLRRTEHLVEYQLAASRHHLRLSAAFVFRLRPHNPQA